MTLYLIGLSILAALQLADVWTTNQVIAGGGREGNPALAWVMTRIGPNVWSWVTLAALIAAYGFVIWNNWGEMREQREKRP